MSFSKKTFITYISNGDYMEHQGRKELQEGKYEQAIQFFEYARKEKPTDLSLLYDLSHAYMWMGQYDKAFASSKEAYLLDARNEEVAALYSKAHLLLHLPMVRPEWVHVSREKKDTWIVHELLEFLVLQLKEKEDLIAYLDLYIGQLMVAVQAGRMEDAAAVVEEMIVQQRKEPLFYQLLTFCYFYSNQIEKAHQALRQAEELDDHRLISSLLHLLLYAEIKDVDQLKRRLETDYPMYVFSSLDEHVIVSYVLSAVGQHESAFQFLSQVLFEKHQELTAREALHLYHHGFFIPVDEAETAYFLNQLLASAAFSSQHFEPLVAADTEQVRYEQNQEIIVYKLNNEQQSERLFGILLAQQGQVLEDERIQEALKQLSHPTDLAFLQFAKQEAPQLLSGEMLRAYQVGELLFEQLHPLTDERINLLQMWFTVCAIALEKKYDFPNEKAIAAAAHYMFGTKKNRHFTKKEVAEQYGVSPATLTKYIEQLIAYLPFSE